MINEFCNNVQFCGYLDNLNEVQNPNPGTGRRVRASLLNPLFEGKKRLPHKRSKWETAIPIEAHGRHATQLADEFDDGDLVHISGRLMNWDGALRVFVCDIISMGDDNTEEEGA